MEFGKRVDGYDIPVINERVARAGAGILFLFALISFGHAFLLHSFEYTKIFITYFMIDFGIRVLINPEYAPSLILGKYFVRFQKPEWVGAPQKRWAWSIGLFLGIVMFLLVVVFEYMTIIKLFICITCLVLLFSEAAFGICLGCKVYTLLNKETKYCSGNSCDVIKYKDKVSIKEKIILILTIGIVLSVIILGKNDVNVGNNNMGMKCKSVKVMKCAPGKCGM